MDINIEDLKKTMVLPDEVLILYVKKNMTGEICKRMGALLQDVFPNNKVIILPSEMRLEKIRQIDLDKLIVENKAE